MSHWNFGICPIKSDLSGNTIWSQTANFQKLAKLDHFLAFLINFCPLKCKRSSLRSQNWMRLFLWFSNTVRIYFHKIVHLLWHPTLQEIVGVHPDAVGFLKNKKNDDFFFAFLIHLHFWSLDFVVDFWFLEHFVLY